MVDLGGVSDLLCAGITDSNGIIKLATYSDVNRLVDGNREDSAPVAPIVGRQIGAASEEAHTQGSLRNNHRAMDSRCRRMSSEAARRSVAKWSGRDENCPSLPAVLV